MNHETWPPDYIMVEAWRKRQLARFEADPEYLKNAKAYYAQNCVAFINHWCSTYDPRRLSKRLSPKVPFILFQKQAELVEFVLECVRNEAAGLAEKCRDAGATWVCCAISIWMWIFHEGSAIGWGSRKQELVDRIGDPSSIFEKLRILINNLPECFLPEDFNSATCLHFMRIVNPENGSTIVGDIGDDIGRGGRTLLYFKDESAHYARPEKVEAALSESTRVPIDISSVNGPNTVFQRKRDNGVDWHPDQPIDPHATNVFVFDWSDHPEKTKEWHDKREAQFRAEGLYHVFAQEVERNAYAAIEGIIIDSRWFDAAVDAHIKLGIEVSGPRMASLDPMDEGLDMNALSIRRGILLQYLSEWTGKDVGATTRKAVDILGDWVIPGSPLVTSYDCIGIGAGVKAEWNRLVADEEAKVPEGLSFTAWNAAAAVQDPYEPVIERIPGQDDIDTKPILNRDFFRNMKAQAWWSLARRFERTYKAVTDPDYTWDPDDLISIPSTLPLKEKLKKEICQPTSSKDSNLKMVVDKKPAGARSPNLADSVMQNYFPVKPRPEPSLGLGGITVIDSKATLGGNQRF